MALVELVTPSGLAPRSLAEKLRRAAGATRAPTPVVQAGSPAGTSGASTCPVATLANASKPNSEIRRATIQFEFFHIILGICVNGSSFFEMRRLVGALSGLRLDTASVAKAKQAASRHRGPKRR